MRIRGVNFLNNITMNEQWKRMLCSPENQNFLEFDETTQTFIDKENNRKYKVVKGVPILLPQNASETALNAEQHQDVGSDFHYADHYQKDAEYLDYFQEYEDGATRHENKRLHEAIANQVTNNKAQKILDVGCGNGWVAKTFCPQGMNVTSMDISTVNPIKALERYPFDNHQAIVADVFALPFKENSFDCVIAAEIIEHVPDPKTFIENLISVIKPGGQLIVTTPYKEKLHYSMCIHCNHPTPRFAHLHSFDEKKLLSLSPLSAMKSWKTLTFNNKYLVVLRSHILMQYFPYQIWRFFDGIVNRIIKKPNRLMLKLVKK